MAGYLASGVAVRSAVSAAAGSGESIRCVPTRKASKPAAAQLDEIVVGTQAGFAHGDAMVRDAIISSNEVSTRVVRVLRSRLFTPMSARLRQGPIEFGIRVHFD